MPQGSESFKFKTKNKYEDDLFKVEDEMYNLDYEIGSFRREMDKLEDEAKKIEAMTEEQKSKHELSRSKFNHLMKRQIVKVYQDIGNKMYGMLFTKPINAVGIILSRFK